MHPQDNYVPIWKVSHGPKVFGQAKRDQFRESQIVVVGGGRGYIQGEDFAEKMKPGHFFYLCHGNSVKVLGRIARDLPKKGGWLRKKYEIIRERISKSGKYRGRQKAWTPNFNSTCKAVPRRELPEFEKRILKPFFGINLRQLRSRHSPTRRSDRLHLTAVSRMPRPRKYGPGGEGKAHKQLKEWLAKNPEWLGLPDRSRVEIEYAFLSGDVADLVFVYGKNGATVVEVETNSPLPGAHQLIKYRALLCAEKNIPLDSPEVKATLVAWSIPAEVWSFCDAYGLKAQEQKL